MKKILIVFICFFILGGISIYLFFHYLESLGPFPDVKQYKAIPFPESSVIYDRNGNELYRIYDEKRTYITYDNISNHMINAIIAGEDKRFWEHSGYDPIGIFRSVCMGVIYRKPFSGTSGITQQLARVTYLTHERTIERKVKELYLSIELESIFAKKEILELYLNKIFFGGNSYGVEQASQTYFGTGASDLGVFEASILASLPKSPSGLSPYTNQEKLVGYPTVTQVGSGVVQMIGGENYKTYSDELLIFSKALKQITATKIGNDVEICRGADNDIELRGYRFDNDGCAQIDYSQLLGFLNKVWIQQGNYEIGYATGRKDYILGRMLQDGYIDFDQYIDAIQKGFGFEFQPYSDDIIAPHFVLYVKQYLEDKYGKDFLKGSGLKIYTTLDLELQNKAQELIEHQVEKNIDQFGAANAALISLDNKTGEVLSMVGAVDYFDTKNGGNNNMIFARLQPGSTFKPFVYSLAMIKNGFSKKTIFIDEQYDFPDDYSPKNSDGKYMGYMSISRALNHSRNIPAVKAYYAAGEEKELIKFLTPFGIENLVKFKQEYKAKFGFSYVYAAPMALGTVEITPRELAQAYSVYANSGVKNTAYPILKIEDGEGNLLYDFSGINNPKNIITAKDADAMNNILSNIYKRPKDWNYFLTLPDRELAAKTGTSSKQRPADDPKDDDIVEPRDLWTVGYTPQITTVVWAGNTDGSALKEKAYGITGSGPIMRDFMKFAHKDLPKEDWK